MKYKKGKVLFLYPNSEGYGGIPNGIALLSRCLKNDGFETKCFDTTFLKSPPIDHFQRQKYGGSIKSDASVVWGKWTPELAEKALKLFLDIIEEFKPDLIVVSFAEVTYKYGLSLLKEAKKKFNIPVIAGGIFTTLSPDIVIDNDCIDVICVGEGEDALVEIAECLVKGRDYTGIRNLWLKKNGKIIKNPLRPLKDMDTLPFQDWSIFDERHFYKPYCGSFYRTAFVELARGCPFNCTYCSTANLRKLFHGLGSFMRYRNIDKALDEACYLKDKYNVELIFFTDDNFLGIPFDRLDYFCKQYKERVNLPFYIQTRSETIREDYIEKLKEINISTIAIGIEHGNEEYRKKYMNRHTTNETIQKAFDTVHKYDIRTTANVMIAMPYENEKTFQDTIRLLRKIKPKSTSISYFQPFRGTKMREMAVEAGYISKDHIINNSINCLNMPQFKPERIVHYYENFQKYVDGELELKKIY